jgi:hypothetical protein
MIHNVNDGLRTFAALLAISLGIVCSAKTPAIAASPSQVPPGYSLTGTGSREDFDYLAGAWTTRQRRLKERNVLLTHEGGQRSVSVYI